MKSLYEAYENLHTALPELIDISERSNQSGLYLVFNGSTKIAWQLEEAKFSILLQSHSLNDDNFCVLKKIDEIKKKLLDHADILGDDVATEVNFDGFRDSLFVYSLSLTLKIYRSLA